MKKFEFRLQRILNWRAGELRAEQERLSNVVSERQQLETRRSGILEAHDRSQRELFAAGPVTGSDLAALGAYRSHLEKDWTAVERLISNCQVRIVAQRVRALEAQRRVRLLEKLQERRHAEWRVEWDREMEAFSSEAFLSRWPERSGRR